MKKITYLLAFFAAAFFTSCEKYNPNPTTPTSVINTSAGSNSGNIFTVAGNGYPGYNGDGGPASASGLHNPTDVAIDNLGNVYIADCYNNCIRKIDNSGTISTFAGNGTAGYSGDGGAAKAAELFCPTGLAIDHLGNVYIADNKNNCIRKVNTNGIISTFAGNGTQGYKGDGGPATSAEFDSPTQVAIDGLGNVSIVDQFNNRVRKVNTSGIISTFAGNGTAGYSGDGGPATSAELFFPIGIVMDASGNIYISDEENECIRKVNTSGIISTIAGNGIAGYSGDGGPATSAELNGPVGMVIDGSGNIYICDASNQLIRVINATGIISTFAGNGTEGYQGDKGPAILAELNYPTGLVIDSYGSIYIADQVNNRIRKVYK